MKPITTPKSNTKRSKRLPLVACCISLLLCRRASATKRKTIQLGRNKIQKFLTTIKGTKHKTKKCKTWSRKMEGFFKEKIKVGIRNLWGWIFCWRCSFSWCRFLTIAEFYLKDELVFCDWLLSFLFYLSVSLYEGLFTKNIKSDCQNSQT